MMYVIALDNFFSSRRQGKWPGKLITSRMWKWAKQAQCDSAASEQTWYRNRQRQDPNHGPVSRSPLLPISTHPLLTPTPHTQSSLCRLSLSKALGQPYFPAGYQNGLSLWVTSFLALSLTRPSSLLHASSSCATRLTFLVQHAT